MIYNSSHFIGYAFDLKRFCFTYAIYMGGSSYAWRLDQLKDAIRLRKLIRKVAKAQFKKRFSLKNKHIYLGIYLWNNSPYHNDRKRLEK